MRFTVALAIGAAVAVSAQSSSSTSSSAAPMTTEEKCVRDRNCGTEVNCIAGCYNVPFPNESQVNATNNCVNKCPKSDNTDAGNKAWGECQNTCIKNHYLPGGSGSSGSDTDSASDSGANSDSSASNAAQATPTDSTGSAASHTASTSGSTLSPSHSASKTSDDDKASNSKSTSSATDTSKPNSAAGLAGASAAVFGLVAALFAM